ncbi:MAG: 2TM domain-containing protein, partial [Candidatus Lokiarchaeota archaeon]|nr:2TM domain-containing protein [Candidatus Lokiarchaeota archaeon]
VNYLPYLQKRSEIIMSGVTGFSEESLRKIAAQKVSYRFSVKIHIVVFILVNILLFIINILFTPEFYWIVFPFFSWLIGVSLHILTYILYARGVYPMSKRGVIYHIDSFIFVMLLLLITNYMTNPGFYWILFPTIFWGGLVILHIIIYIRYFSTKIESNGKGTTRKERAIEKELEKMRKKHTQKDL